MFKFKKEDEEKIAYNQELIQNLIKQRLNYLPENIIKMEKKINNKKLNEMCDYLKKCKNEKKNKLLNKTTIIKDEKFKELFCNNLEVLIVQLLSCHKEETFKEKLNIIYNWFQKKLNEYNSIKNINEKSYDININDYKHFFIKKKKSLDFDEKIEDEKQHRSFIPNSNKLKEFNFKNIKLSQNNLVDKIKEIDENNDLKEYEKNKLKHQIKSLNQPQIKTIRKIVMYENLENKNKIIPSSDFSFITGTKIIDKKIINEKNNDLSNKRNEEEINKNINEFGKKRALFKGNSNKKFEIKKLIKNYSNIIKKTKNISISKKNTKEIKNSFIKNYKTKKINSYKESPKKKFIKQKSLQIKRNFPILNSFNKSFNILPKVSLNNIQNINQKSKIIFNNSLDNGEENEEEKTFYLSFRLSKSKSLNNLFFFHKKNKQILNDTIFKYTTIDKLFKYRINYSKIINTPEISNSIQNSFSQNQFNLSNDKNKTLYNEMNKTTIKYNLKNLKRNEILKHNFSNSENDFLQIRKDMENINNNDYLKIRHKYNNNINNNALKKAFLIPNIKFFYPLTFLPNNNGFNLLLNKPKEYDIKTKKHNKKK